MTKGSTLSLVRVTLYLGNLNYLGVIKLTIYYCMNYRNFRNEDFVQ